MLLAEGFADEPIDTLIVAGGWGTRGASACTETLAYIRTVAGRARRVISIGARSPMTILTFVFSPPSNTLAIRVEALSASRGTGEPRSRSWRKSRSASLLIPWKRLSIESRIWRPFGSFAGTKRVV